MKPKNRNESWCYTLTKRGARKKAKRLRAKRRRRERGEGREGD